MFCVWKMINNEKKKRVIIDIRDLNAITQSNVYFLSFQTKIIFVVIKCQYIIVIDCFDFFYQWRIHSKNRYKFTIISHHDQKFFNVIVIKYKNSFTYVQRQIDRLLRSYKFVKIYVDDIVIYFKILKKHFFHFRVIFDILTTNSIFIKFEKTFVEYFTMYLLNQKIDFLELTTIEKKLKVISKLKYSQIFQILKIYLRFIDWLRDYISMYVDIIKSFQQLKNNLLRDEFIIEFEKKSFSRRTRLTNSTTKKLIFFEIFQSLLSKSFYLIYSNNSRKLYANLNINKKFDLNVITYYVKSFVFVNWNDKEYFSRKSIESILFLSRFFTSIKTRYWFIKLKLTNIIWVFRKIRHIVESSKKKFSIIFTNHDVVLDIAKQISLIISSTNKLNLRLIKTSNYIQRFDLEIRHKLEKQHIIFDAFSRLTNTNIKSRIFDENNELNVLFITILIEIEKVFRNKFIVDYKSDLNWQKIVIVLDTQNKNDFIF